MVDAILSTELELPRVHRGKVRDIYAAGDRLLFVATDRLSAFDVVFHEGIPEKGRVLTQVSLFWASRLAACKPYHLVTERIEDMPVPKSEQARLRGRTLLVERLEMMPIECVVRGYLVGSGWKDYQATGKVCGHQLPKGMQNGDRLETPLFTPATKAPMGDHDENISFEEAVQRVGAATAHELRDRSLAIFREASELALARGLILVDTKLEFGRRPSPSGRGPGALVLGDEVLTPDSSRYWDRREAEATPRGHTPPSFDKQGVRDYLETLAWNKKPPPPPLPAELVARTSKRYLELVERLTGAPLKG